MDGHEFDFPPDPVSSGDLQTPSFHVTPPSLPFHDLLRMPIDQLPPTPAPAAPYSTIGQLVRGGMHKRLSQGSLGTEVSGGSASQAGLPRPAVGARMNSQGPEGASYWRSEPSGSAYDGSQYDRSAAVQSAAEAGLQTPAEASGTTSHTGEHETLAPAMQETGAGRHQRLEWTQREVREFYKGLSQFGTDFGAIAVLFPNRDRNQVKKLYQREYRKHRADVLQALENKEAVDMEVYEKLLKERKEQEAPQKKQLASTEEALLHEIATGVVPPRAHSEEGLEPEYQSLDDAGGMTLAEFAMQITPSSSKGGPRENKAKPTEDPAHPIGGGRKRGRADHAANDDKDARPPALSKHPRRDHHDVAPPGSEETLFEMMQRQEKHRNKQTLLEAALDGEFGSLLAATSEATGGDAADDFAF